MARRRTITGLTKTTDSGAGLRIFVRVNGKLRSKRFALDADPDDIQQWRDDEMEKGKGGRVVAAVGSFAEAVATFLALPAVAAMTTVHQYARMLGLWLDALGRDRLVAEITSLDIERVLQDWLARLAEPTVYHRRTALMTLFRTLYPDTPNPVLKTTVPAHENPKDESRDYGDVQRVLAHMQSDRYIAKGIRRPSLAKLRAAVVAATGIPPGVLLSLRPNQVDLEAGFIDLPPRKKGKGTTPRRLDLNAYPEAIATFRSFVAGNAWGYMIPAGKPRYNAVSAISKSLKRAARAVLGPSTTFHLYALRHCFAADALVAAKGDEATVARLLQHAPGSRCTSRYTMGAHAKVDATALGELAKLRKAAVTPHTKKRMNKLPPRVTTRRKSRVIKHLRRGA